MIFLIIILCILIISVLANKLSAGVAQPQQFDWDKFSVPAALASYQSPTAFSIYVLGITPHDYQVEGILENPSDRILVCWGRQLGKTFTLALYCIWFTSTRRNKLAVILAPAMRQAKIMYNQIRKLITENEILNSMCQKHTETEIVWKNGSRILNVTVGEKKAESLRGESIDLLLIDEFEIVKHDREVWGNVNPTTASTHGKIIIISTPRTKTSLFYTFFCMAKGIKNELTEEYSKNIKKEFVPKWSLANDKLLDRLGLEHGLPSMYGLNYIRADTGLPQISMRVLLDARATTDDIHFKQEYCAMFLEAELSYFSLGELDFAQRHPYVYEQKYSGECYLGIDWGGKKDSTAMTIIAKENIEALFKDDWVVRTIARWEFKPTDYPGGECEHDKEIKFVEDRIIPFFNIVGIFTDETGIGHEASRQLERMFEQTGIYVERISFQRVNKYKIIARLKILMQQGRYLIPKSDNVFRSQFTNVHIKFLEQTKTETLYCPEGLRDDIVVAAAAACCGIEDEDSHTLTFTSSQKRIKEIKQSTEISTEEPLNVGFTTVSRSNPLMHPIGGGSGTIISKKRRRARRLREIW